MNFRLCLGVLGVAAAVAAAGPAGAQNYGRMLLCKAVKDNAERLQCYDRAAAESSGTTASNTPQVESAPIESGNWHISESRSASDGSSQLAAVLQASEGSGALVIRCYSRSTDIYVTLRTYLGGAEPLPVVYRINDGSPIETRWLPSRDGNAVFVPSITIGIEFLRSLPDASTIAMTVRDFQAHSNQLTFELGPMKDVRDRVATFCNWPAEQRATTPPPATSAASPAPVASAAPGAATAHSKGKVITVQPHQQRWNVAAERR